MRTTLACQWCRGSKIKCHHDGSPPCRACLFNPGRECVLSRPKHRSKRLQSASTVRTNTLPPDSEYIRPVEIQDANSRSRRSDIAPAATHENQVSSSQKDLVTSRLNPSTATSPLKDVDRKTLEHALHIFVNQFPEFRFFHEPTFLESLDAENVPELKLCGILAISARFLPQISGAHEHPREASEFFANHIRQKIMNQVFGAMDIDAVQALLLLSLHDWGNGNGSHAWTYNGMATRMVHGIYAQAADQAKTTPSFANIVRQEEVCRTVWACFLLDAMIGCGKCQSSRFTMSTRDVPLPLSEDHFAFGDPGPSERNFLEIFDPETDPRYPLETPSHETIGSDQIPALTICGFHIWSTISAWVSAGGRRRELDASRAPPWEGSSFWSRSMAALEDWRASQSPQLFYSPANMNLQVYISRKEGERFAMINLIYYLSLIFLHREYVPFIPHAITRPCGPTDPPLILQEPPEGWWDQSAQALFSAASSIILILQQLDQRKIKFQTPFTCFCVFSAASTLLYANAWPHMAPGLDHQSSMRLYSWAYSWLHQACSVWKVSEGWYSTLVFLTHLYSRVSSDPVQFPGVSRDVFLALEENIQRLAGSEPPDSPGLPAANILLMLQRQTQSIKHPNGTQGTRSTEDCVPNADSLVGATLPTEQVSGEGSSSELPTSWMLGPELGTDYDFLAGILSDPSGDWVHPT